MIKWNLFKKNRQKESEINNFNHNDDEQIIDKQENTSEDVEDINLEEIKEYSESLYTSDDPNFKPEKKPRRNSWESTSTIEKSVDQIDKKRKIYKKTSAGSDKLEKKVDQLLRSKGITSSKKK